MKNHPFFTKVDAREQKPHELKRDFQRPLAEAELEVQDFADGDEYGHEIGENESDVSYLSDSSDTSLSS
jgi:hypothetical protein